MVQLRNQTQNNKINLLRTFQTIIKIVNQLTIPKLLYVTVLQWHASFLWIHLSNIYHACKNISLQYIIQLAVCLWAFWNMHSWLVIYLILLTVGEMSPCWYRLALFTCSTSSPSESAMLAIIDSMKKIAGAYPIDQVYKITHDHHAIFKLYVNTLN